MISLAKYVYVKLEQQYYLVISQKTLTSRVMYKYRNMYLIVFRQVKTCIFAELL